jgi:Na+-translocating ferredoxin:NAD+ oxidoreductase RnfC subunit
MMQHLLEEIKENGVVGAGGAGFPTAVKLTSRPDTVIMNAAECEPLLHKDIQLLIHYPEQVINGLKQVMTITGAKSGVIGLKAKHKQLLKQLKSFGNERIRLIPVGDFYPAGDEVTLVYLTMDRLIQPGKLPITVGCLVQNVETLYNITIGKPVVDKYLTVAGAVKQPRTICAPIGASFKDILKDFQILAANYAVISNGLMMGHLENDLNTVVSKRTGGIIVLPTDHPCVQIYQRYATEHQTVRLAKTACDQCNFCTEFCPRYLLGHPVRPETAMRNRMFSDENEPALALGNRFCCECNLCTLYACPEGLDPKGATVIEKKHLIKNNMIWEGLPRQVHPMFDYRRVPTKKLMQRLDVLQYSDIGPLEDSTIVPDKVSIPLLQHAGAPAKPIVKDGERVQRYQLLAQADGRISAPVHASISGRIISLDQEKIVIKRET